MMEEKRWEDCEEFQKNFTVLCFISQLLIIDQKKAYLSEALISQNEIRSHAERL